MKIVLDPILEFASKHNYNTQIKTLGVLDNFIEHGGIEELQKTS